MILGQAGSHRGTPEVHRPFRRTWHRDFSGSVRRFACRRSAGQGAMTMSGDTGVFVVALFLLYLAIFLIFGVALRPRSALPMSRRRPNSPAQPTALTRL